MSTPAEARPKGAYLHKGQMLASPPVSAQISSALSSTYVFFGLYFTTFFSLDPMTAAQNSPFSKQNRQAGRKMGWGFGGGRGGSDGKGPGGGGGGPGRKIGRVDDVRGPECKSCQG